MSKYGYISLDMLYEYAMNTVDKTVSPNEFMRMPRANVIPIEWMKSWAMKNWVKTGKCEFDIIVSKMIDDWEKKNERTNG